MHLRFLWVPSRAGVRALTLPRAAWSLRRKRQREVNSGKKSPRSQEGGCVSTVPLSQLTEVSTDMNSSCRSPADLPTLQAVMVAGSLDLGTYGAPSHPLQCYSGSKGTLEIKSMKLFLKIY